MCRQMSEICKTTCLEAFRTIIFTCQIDYFKYNLSWFYKFFKELIAVPLVVKFISCLKDNTNCQNTRNMYVF